MKSKHGSLKKKYAAWKYDHPVGRVIVENAFLMVMCSISSFIFAFGFKTFMAPQFTYQGESINNIVTGGASGFVQDIVLLFNDLHVNLPGGNGLWHSVLYTVVNIPLMILCFFGIGKRFTIYTILTIVEFTLFGIVLDLPACQTVLAQVYAMIPENGGLIARTLFGGVCTGLSEGIAFKLGFCTGGLDILTYYVASKKRTSIGKYNVFVNVIIVLVFFVLSLFKEGNNLTTACETFYAVLYMIVSALVVDMIHIRNKKVEIKIVTSIPELSDVLLANIPHGATITKGIGAFSNEEKIIISTVVSSLEEPRIVKLMRENDPNCFIQSTTLNQVYGRFFLPDVK